MYRKPYLRVIVLSLILLGVHCVASAQPTDPQSGGDPDVPITGIEILLGIGGLIGARKAYLVRKKK